MLSKRLLIEFLMERGTHHQYANAAALHQELDALHGLRARAALARTKGNHHLHPGRLQFRVDDLQDRRVESTGQDGDIHAYGLGAAQHERTRHMRGPEVQALDGFLHQFPLGGRHRALAAHDARCGTHPHAGQTCHIFQGCHKRSSG
jgi:hypothetical protein